ncbi:class I SAM-dependent methyltransferase [Cytophagaceae bacterium ABcell3]|nr:class I SAM-dependent methyltransferase [Cytophagaceae bacterium ABcell3]
MLKELYRTLSPKFQTVNLDYKVDAKPRYGHGAPGHQLLHKVINENRMLYREYLKQFLNYSEQLQKIKAIDEDENNVSWENGYLPGLDIIGLYGMVAKHKPKQYIEIGSGNSTKVVKKAIKEQGLATRITSIDPCPRANIDHLADKVIRQPFEELTNLTPIIESLQKDDILFIDNSHRAFPNSDVTVCFLELLPYLKEGVIVQFHDIYLPYDYPQFMCQRFYNEQYMLAAFILSNPKKYNPILPNYFISEDEELKQIIAPLYKHSNLNSAEKHGGSFWLQIK